MSRITSTPPTSISSVRGSLFELLAAARTRMGEETLAGWLLKPAAPGVVRERRSLSPGICVPDSICAKTSPYWANTQASAFGRMRYSPGLKRRISSRVLGALATAIALPVLALAGDVLVWSIAGIATPLLVILVIEAMVLYSFKQRLETVLRGTETAFEDLRLFAALLLRLEREPFTAEPLKELIRQLSSHTLSASKTISRLGTVVGFMEARRNPIMGVLEVPLMYSLHHARCRTLARGAWRGGPRVGKGGWRVRSAAVAGGLSLRTSGRSVSRTGRRRAAIRRHLPGPPLLAAERCVRNDVRVGDESRVLLISGSNMSGKSTLLRTVGVNVVLAMAGAPVRAQATSSHSVTGWRQHPDQRLTARRQLTLLRGDHSPSSAARAHAKAAVTALPAGRAAPGHELERPPHRRGRRRESLRRTRGHRTHQHPRSGSHGHQRPRPGCPSQRALPGRNRKRPHEVRLHAARRHRDEEQWDRVDAVGGAECMSAPRAPIPATAE